jgi:hypothetical protein
MMVDGVTVESGTIGREGTSGVPVLLDAWRTAMQTFVQVPGEDRSRKGGGSLTLLPPFLFTREAGDGI